MRHGLTSILTDRLNALSDALRLRMLRLLESNELSVGEVAKVFQLPQSTVSRHLTMLSKAGWLVKRQRGTATFYSLTLDDLDQDARGVWIVVRDQIGAGPEIEEDDLRLEGVLAERRIDSVSFFGRVGGEWDAIRNELFGERLTALGLLSLIHPDWTVADIGCGTGNAAELLAGCVERVIAVDQSETMLEAARLRVGSCDRVSFVRGSLEALPLEDGSVDAVCCLLVMHHVEAPAEAMRELARTLRTSRGGGVALVVDMAKHERHEYRRDMGHRHLGFSDEEIVSMFEESGFATPRIRHLPGEPEAKGPGLFAAAAGLRAAT
ncbi:MAG: metalloregulator ArsR/SmtB family transcription factor [Phycisphaeraceae bacterium]|nr:MAG: metalloregulator ArsR/SmtB family transcription factor [Phycisphaeraceae bacterium]